MCSKAMWDSVGIFVVYPERSDNHCTEFGEFGVFIKFNAVHIPGQHFVSGK